MGSCIRCSLNFLYNRLVVLQSQWKPGLHVTVCHLNLLSLEQVCNSTDLQVPTLILSCQTILYQVRLLEVCLPQMVLEGVKAREVKGAEVEEVEEVEGAMLEDMVMEGMRTKWWCSLRWKGLLIDLL